MKYNDDTHITLITMYYKTMSNVIDEDRQYVALHMVVCALENVNLWIVHYKNTVCK